MTLQVSEPRTQPRRAELIAAFVALMVLALSQVTCREQESPPERERVSRNVQRSGGAGWQVRTIQSERISLSVPDELCGWVDAPRLGGQVSLHRLSAPLGVLDDDRCLNEIRLQRFESQLLRKWVEDQLAVLETSGARATYHQWNLATHTVVSRFEEHDRNYYRYDVTCRSGDVIRIAAEVTNVYDRGRRVFASQDDLLVRRILGSVRCLEDEARSH